MYKDHAYGFMSQYNIKFDLTINVGHSDLHFAVQYVLPYILKNNWCVNIILVDYESVWPEIGHKN